MNKESKRIIIVENDNIFVDVFSSMLSKNNIEFDLARDIASLNILLQENDYGLAIVDFPFARDKEFSLLSRLKDQYNLPIIITTEHEIDDYMDFIVKNNICMILVKPFKTTELLTAIGRILDPYPENCFGLENYIQDIKYLKKVEITNSLQIRSVIEQMHSSCKEWGFEFNQRFEMDLVWQEILINAIYHSHGFSVEKEERKAIELPKPYKVEIRFGASESQFGVSVRDFMGTLSAEKIFSSISNAVSNQKAMEEATKKGEDFMENISLTGRGLDLIRKIASEYYFVIQPKVSTEAVIIYDKYFEKDDDMSSLRILEVK